MGPMGESRARFECSEVYECMIMRADRRIVPSGGTLDFVSESQLDIILIVILDMYKM